MKPQFYSVWYMLQPPPTPPPDFDSKSYHEDPEGPPICCGTVTLAVHHLWGHVFHGSTERVCLLLLKYRLFAQTKVCQLYVAFMIQQDATKNNLSISNM